MANGLMYPGTPCTPRRRNLYDPRGRRQPQPFHSRFYNTPGLYFATVLYSASKFGCTLAGVCGLRDLYSVLPSTAIPRTLIHLIGPLYYTFGRLSIE